MDLIDLAKRPDYVFQEGTKMNQRDLFRKKIEEKKEREVKSLGME